ncbi:hypothetical protein MMC30_004764 [Trapelia coarctata]|nr:hypothetical protein [Trapelia coarctata]
MLVFTLIFLLAAFSKAEIAFPSIALPWGTYQATQYDADGDFFTIPNIRFGAASLGPLRFSASVYPSAIPDPSVVQNSSYGPSCPQVDATRPCTPGGNIVRSMQPAVELNEDCLFLDIYVPRSALSGGPPLPVVVWFFGGAFVFGSKDLYGPEFPFYNGTGLLRAAQSGVIFVAGNYRLGAYGWLAGNYMERAGTPNAGFSDQRLLLQWVQDYIHLLGGDKQQVSAWGESAGAGSIVHHLMRHGGQEDPLFTKAIVQSPAFQWQWDRNPHGTLDQVYRNFSKLVGCGDAFDIDCLRNAKPHILTEANQLLYELATPCTGLFPVGPSVDGDLIQQLPVIAFASGNYWKNLESIIVSHVANESGSFIPKYIQTEADVTTFIDDFLPEDQLNEIRDAVQAQYPASGPPYDGDQRRRVENLIRDSTFTCNTRDLYDAYKGKAWMMQYDFLSSFNEAVHSADLLPTFWNSDVNITGLIETYGNIPSWIASLVTPILTMYAAAYQSYFASHAISGNPNTQRDDDTVEWLMGSDNGNEVTDVLETSLGDPKVGLPFFIADTVDKINSKDICDFWKEVAINITKFAPSPGSGGYLRVPNTQSQLVAEL